MAASVNEFVKVLIEAGHRAGRELRLARCTRGGRLLAHRLPAPACITILLVLATFWPCITWA